MPDAQVFRALQRVNVETQIPYFKVFKSINQANKLK